MSACKSPKHKPELVAIYRLEFYKKQKNWKLCSSPYSKKSSKKPLERKNDLNTTYNVEECAGTNEPSDPLNEAFVDFDSDEIQTQNVTSKLSIPKKNELSQQWLEPVNIWPDVINNNIKQGNKNVRCLEKDINFVFKNRRPAESDVEKPVRHCTTHRLQQLQKAAQLQEQQENMQNILKESMNYLQCKESNANECNYNREDYEGNHQYFCGQDNCPSKVGVQLHAEHMAQDIWPGEKDMDDNSEDILYSAAWFPKPVSQLDSAPLATTGAGDLEDWCDLSVDSIGEFMRGADVAPHSSEVDLVLPSEMDVADTSFTALSRLSTEQLVLAARLHSRVLRRLLLESEQRQTTECLEMALTNSDLQRLRRAAELPSAYSSIEEFPTRDVGPGPCHGPNIYTDAFVAGSHLQSLPGVPLSSLRSAGRGRGRLI